MKVINLFENSETVTLKKFAGGECHVKLNQVYTEMDRVRINTRLNTSDDIMNLMLTVDALRHMLVKYIEVFLPYVPYARQDRLMNSGESLSIKVFANLLNALSLDKVLVYDAHSDVAVALIDRCHNIKNHDMVQYFVNELKLQDYHLVAPDLGAYKKTDQLSRLLNYKNEIITGLKIRNLQTGDIEKLDVSSNNLEGKSCLIVDDICDGGRTFMELAKVLKSKNAGDLYLVVSHGIFSYNALDKLKESGFKMVGSSNSISNLETNEFYQSYDLF